MCDEIDCFSVRFEASDFRCIEYLEWFRGGGGGHGASDVVPNFFGKPGKNAYNNNGLTTVPGPRYVWV